MLYYGAAAALLCLAALVPSTPTRGGPRAQWRWRGGDHRGHRPARRRRYDVDLLDKLAKAGGFTYTKVHLGRAAEITAGDMSYTNRAKWLMGVP